jgi:hypothetical protein
VSSKLGVGSLWSIQPIIEHHIVVIIIVVSLSDVLNVGGVICCTGGNNEIPKRNSVSGSGSRR